MPDFAGVHLPELRELVRRWDEVRELRGGQLSSRELDLYHRRTVA